MYIIKHYNDEVIIKADSREEMFDKLCETYKFNIEEYTGELKEIDGTTYTAEKVDEIIAQREKAKEDKFNREFFNTSLGYIRRKCFMAGTGETKDFLTDILPQLTVGFEIIAYNFMATEQFKVRVTEEFIVECKQVLVKDFYPVGE